MSGSNTTKDFQDTRKLSSFLQDVNVFVLVSIVGFFFLTCCILLSVYVATVALLSVLAGLAIPFLILRNARPFPNLLQLLTVIKNGESDGINQQMPRSCSVCGGSQCAREITASMVAENANAYIDFTVPQSVDEALEELLTLALDNHMYSWYKEFTVNDQLADEIRYIIRYSVASLASRLSKVDLASVITEQLLPALVRHLDTYVEGSRKGRGGISVEGAVVNYLNAVGQLHWAVTSREAETAYLRGVAKAISPFLLPSKYHSSSLGRSLLEEVLSRVLLLLAMDLLAEPDKLNMLFLLLFSKEPMDRYPDRIEPQALLLKNFASVNTHPRNSVLRGNLSAVLKDQTLLYLFHTFLKEEKAINILQFCLAVEDFNRHILNPDLTPEQLERLHLEALDLYHTYMVTSAVDHVNFPLHIVAEIREIVHGDVIEVVKLRTTRPLFQAYEHAYNLLEREFLPLFMNSHAYFTHLCGLKDSQTSQKNANRDAAESSHVGGGVGQAVRKVGSGLKQIGKLPQMVWQPLVVVGGDEGFGAFPYPSQQEVMAEEICSLSEPRQRLRGITLGFRDLSAWRVSIPRLEQKTDYTGKPYYAFVVRIMRIDVAGDERPEDTQWEIDRRYHEFYVLENKLTEFHGEMRDNHLPPRRYLFPSLDPQYMDTRRVLFEEYLQRLLQTPVLRGSQLVFLFLKTQDEFTVTGFLPDVTLTRFLKDVPRKLLSKERGQHLDPFIKGFLASSGASYDGKTSILQFEEGIAAVEQDIMSPSDLAEGSDCLLSTVFGNNAANHLVVGSEPPMGLVTQVGFSGDRVCGVLDTVLFVDVLYFDPPSERNEMDFRQCEAELRQNIVSLIPCFLRRLLCESEDAYLQGANTLVDVFQQPALNKQLSYVLLDSVMDQLFPELSAESVFS